MYIVVLLKPICDQLADIGYMPATLAISFSI